MAKGNGDKPPLGGVFAVLGGFLGMIYGASIADFFGAVIGLSVGVAIGLFVEELIFRVLLIILFIITILVRQALWDAIFDSASIETASPAFVVQIPAFESENRNIFLHSPFSLIYGETHAYINTIQDVLKIMDD